MEITTPSSENYGHTTELPEYGRHFVIENLASSGQRFGNHVLDLIFSYVLASLIGALAMVLGFYEILEAIPNFILGIVIGIVYYLTFELATGRTPGKMITGTMVVTEHGEIPNSKTILIRTLCRFIPFDALSYLFSEDTVGWHDDFSNTRVIKKTKINLPFEGAGK